MSNLLLITTLHKIKNIHHEIDISMNNVKMQNCDTVKVLGIYINETPSINYHIDKAISQLNWFATLSTYFFPQKHLTLYTGQPPNLCLIKV